MIARYSIGLGDQVGDVSQGVTNRPDTFHHGHVVLLTGSTGGLGSYLLASLLSRKDVAIVYAVNRPSKSGTIKQRQHAAFEDRGLDPAIIDSAKLVYVEGDLARSNLSFDDRTYREIRDSVTVIIHNAWRIDFNLALSSFGPNVKGMRNLIDLARGSRRASKPRFLFTSSVASAQGWDKSKESFPEEVQFDAGVAVGPGYGASKYVSERVRIHDRRSRSLCFYICTCLYLQILAASSLPATSFRIGQITGGAPRGAWSTTDWIPIIVKSSVTLGTLPEAHGVSRSTGSFFGAYTYPKVTSWLPPYAVSDAILDVAFADEEPPPTMNLVHPRPVTWKSVVQPISEAIYQKGLTSSPLPLISFTQWVERLEKHAVDTSEEDVRRAVSRTFKLLDDIESLMLSFYFCFIFAILVRRPSR